MSCAARRSVTACARALARGGTYFFVGGSTAVIFRLLLLGPWIRRTKGKHLRMLVVPQNRADLTAITQLCEEGKVVPVIDRQYALSEVPAAMRYVVAGHARGKVVITVSD